jgi:hypothetical protein
MAVLTTVLVAVRDDRAIDRFIAQKREDRPRR